MGEHVVALQARRPSSPGEAPDRLRVLLELLNRPDRAVPTIWVGGEHGKSSVVVMVAALFAALEVTAGAATSPHLQDVRERLRIAGEAITAETLRDTLRYLEPFLQEVDTRYPLPLTFDEVLHALAATWFADAPVDVAVFEGVTDPSGRGDVVVRLAGPATTVTGGDGQDRTLGMDFGIADRRVAVGGQQLTLRGTTAEVADVYLPLHGAHQGDNAATALAAVEAFLGFSGGLDAELIRTAFASVRLPGRLEVVRREAAASVLLDGARDARSAAALATALKTEFTLRNRIGVLALVGDDPAPVIGALAGAVDHLVVAPPNTPDAAAVEDVVAAARSAGMAVEAADTIPAALELASGVATAEDAVVVTGGLQTVGAARRMLGLAPADDLMDTRS
jgi:dihydrofolate synthase/folylpolyglutamate synthase